MSEIFHEVNLFWLPLEYVQKLRTMGQEEGFLGDRNVGNDVPSAAHLALLHTKAPNSHYELALELRNDESSWIKFPTREDYRIFKEKIGYTKVTPIDNTTFEVDALWTIWNEKEKFCPEVRSRVNV